MRLSRVLPVLLLLASPLVAGCGGDDAADPTQAADTDTDTESAAESDAGDEPDADGEPPFPLMQGEACAAEVTLTGAIEAQWNLDGTVDVPGASDVAPPATYQAAQGDTVLTVSAAGNGFDTPTVLVQQGLDGSYGVTPGEGRVEVADDGSGATIDAEAASVAGGDGVQIQATFSC